MLGALVGLVVGQFRSRASLVAENDLLRQQLAAAKSRLQRKRVMFTGSQRLTIALLTRWTASSADTGGNNTADGVDALRNNIIGSDNTANGHRALLSNATGSYNTAVGPGQMFRYSI